MILSIKQSVFLVLTLCVITLSSVRAQETGAVIGRNLKKTKPSKPKNSKAAKNGKNDKKTKAPKKTKAKKNDKQNKKNKKTKAPETTSPLTNQPTAVPTMKPTSKPTNQPTAKPTMKPTMKPTLKPTMEPTNEPTPSPEPIAFVTLPITVGFAGDGSGIIPDTISDVILLGAFNAFRGAIIGDVRRRLDEVDDTVDGVLSQRFEDECIEITSRLTESGCVISDPSVCTVRTESDAKVVTDGEKCAAQTDEEIESKEEEKLEIASDIGEGETELEFELTIDLDGVVVAPEPITIPSDMPSTSPSQSPSIESAYPSPAI